MQRFSCCNIICRGARRAQHLDAQPGPHRPGAGDNSGGLGGGGGGVVPMAEDKAKGRNEKYDAL